MKLNELSPVSGQKKSRKRLGRGNGSGNGTTAGRGTKGQKSRSGGNVRPGFEGGQMPIHRRLPKRGFTNIFKSQYLILNIWDLKKFESNSNVDKESLLKMGLIKSKGKMIKLLGKGEITYPLHLKINKISKSAKQKIEQSGGSFEAVQ